MADLDLDIETARLARAGVERIVAAGDHGAVRVTVQETVAMARTIRVLVAHIGRLEQTIEDALEDRI